VGKNREWIQAEPKCIESPEFLRTYKKKIPVVVNSTVGKAFFGD